MLEEVDQDILDQAIDGDLEAFSNLYEKYIERIYNYVYYRIGNTHDAEDVTAKVFHRALGRITVYKKMGVPFSAWLYRIAHNLVANWHRDKSRKKEIQLEEDVELIPSSQQPEILIVKNQENEALINVIRKFSPERQQLIILKFVEKLSNEEIGMIMGRSEGAIKSLYHRTLLALKKEYKHIE